MYKKETINEKVIQLAQKIWNYHQMNHKPVPCDCIMALGSHDLRVAERAAELYLQRMAPIVIFSGGLGRLTEGSFPKPEAELFADVAMEMGVPQHAIFIENKSTNTGENISFTRMLLAEQNLNPASFLLVQKPYMERRCWATFKQNWPGKEILVTSPQLPMLAYPNAEIPIEQVIQIMVGDLQRIKLYPAKGFQVYQHIPKDVWDAFEQLVAMGFDQQLMKN